MPKTLNIELPKFFSTAALADEVKKKRVTVQLAIREGRLVPDALLLQSHRRPVALFTENRLESIRAKMAEVTAQKP